MSEDRSQPDERLDTLLSAPLETVADDGFSARVVARIGRDEWMYSLLETVVLAAFGILLLLVVPFPEAGDVAMRLSEQVAESVPLAMAALAILLSFWWLQATSED